MLWAVCCVKNVQLERMDVNARTVYQGNIDPVSIHPMSAKSVWPKRTNQKEAVWCVCNVYREGTKIKKGGINALGV